MPQAPLLRAHARESGTVLALIALCIALTIASPHFATVTNLLNVAEQTTIIGTLAVGMTFVILTGGIDLSVGSVVAVCGVACGLLAQRGAPPLLAIAGALVVGVLCGMLNGMMVTRAKLPPFIATLGMMSVARGVALLLSDGRSISQFPAAIRSLGVSRVGGVPLPIVVMALIYGIAALVLLRTTFGRHVYAVGGNEEASRFAGVRVQRVKFTVYVIAGVLSAITSLILVARLDSAQPTAGNAYELDAIAAVVVGGTSLLGGTGTVLGTLVGALILSVLRNGLNLLDVSAYIQQIAIGAVIVVAVAIDLALRNRRVAS